MKQLSWSVGRLLARTHTMFAITILFLVTAVMAGQVSFRGDFAATELYSDVMERWGTPIVQPVPSVRYVEHGAVFHELEPLPLAHQHVTVDADMNYRKRGLVYFSGFDFTVEHFSNPSVRFRLVESVEFPLPFALPLSSDPRGQRF